LPERRRGGQLGFVRGTRGPTGRLRFNAPPDIVADFEYAGRDIAGAA
jgi:hypothetical protein